MNIFAYDPNLYLFMIYSISSKDFVTKNSEKYLFYSWVYKLSAIVKLKKSLKSWCLAIANICRESNTAYLVYTVMDIKNATFSFEISGTFPF